MKKMTTLAVLVCMLSACASKAPELKSPCVGAEGSPCGPRIKVNEHWMKQTA